MKLTEFLNEWVKNPDNYTCEHIIGIELDTVLILKKTNELLSKLKECDEFKSAKNLQFIDSIFFQVTDGKVEKSNTILYQNKQKTTHDFKLNNYIYSIQLVPVLKTSEEFLNEDGFGCFISETKFNNHLPYKEVCFKISLENGTNFSIENQLPVLLKNLNVDNHIVGYDIFLRGMFYSSYEPNEINSYDVKNMVNYLTQTTDEFSECLYFSCIPDDCIDEFQKEFGFKNCILSLDDINSFLIKHNHPPI